MLNQDYQMLLKNKNLNYDQQVLKHTGGQDLLSQVV